MIKSIAIATAVVVLSAGMASAKPYGSHNEARHYGHHQTGKLTVKERIGLALKRARLARMKRRIISDGIVTRRESNRLRAATYRYKAAVRNERRD